MAESFGMAAIGGGYSTALVPAVEDATATGGATDPIVWVDKLAKRLEKSPSLAQITLEDITQEPAPTGAERLLGSPRSIKACLKCGFDPEVLIHKPLAAFARKGVSAELQQEGYDLSEEKRKGRVAKALACRETLDNSLTILDKISVTIGGDGAESAALQREQVRLEKIKAKQAREAESRAKLDAVRAETAAKAAENDRKAAERAAEHERQKRERLAAAKQAEYEKAQKLKMEAEKAADEAAAAAAKRHEAEVEAARKLAEQEKERKKEMLAAEAERKAKAEEWRKQTEAIQLEFEKQQMEKQKELEKQEEERKEYMRKFRMEQQIMQQKKQAEFQAQRAEQQARQEQILEQKRQEADARFKAMEERQRRHEAEKKAEKERRHAEQEAKLLHSLKVRDENEKKERERADRIIAIQMDKARKQEIVKQQQREEVAQRALRHAARSAEIGEKVMSAKRQEAFQRVQLNQTIKNGMERASAVQATREKLQVANVQANMKGALLRSKMREAQEEEERKADRRAYEEQHTAKLAVLGGTK